MCGGAPAPEDNSAEVARIEAQQARAEAERIRREERRDEKLFNRNLSGAFGTSLEAAKNYFNQQGISPDSYIGDITTAANSIRGSVPFLDQNPGSYFTGLGENTFKNLETGFRNKNLNTIDSILPQNFSTQRITNDVDDATIEAILGEQRGTAEDYLSNLLARGVVTNSGYQGGLKNLDRQAGSARASLDEIGRSLLEGGRGDIDQIITGAQQAASNLRLGQQFDPYSYKSQAQEELENFFSTLGNSFRSKAPTDLFDTSGLAGVAGASQGAQNTKFDANALAGIFGDEPADDDDENKNKNSNPFASNSPFG